jgi:hypothetical protein
MPEDRMKEIPIEGAPQLPQQEKSTVESYMKMGPTPEQMKAWQGPEWISELPDIRMQLDDDLLKRLQEREGYERSQQGSEYDKGRSVEAVIARHPNPDVVRSVLRVLQLREETFNTFGEPDNRWDVSHRVTTLRDRANALAIPPKDILGMELAVPLSDDEKAAVRAERGKAIPAVVHEDDVAKPKHVEGFGIDTYTINLPVLTGYELDKDGNRTNQKIQMVPETFVYLGKENERKEKSKEYEKLTDEVTARSLMMQLWNHHTTYYYALQKLAEGHYFPATLSSEGLGVLFNLKRQEGAATKTITGVELRSLGDKVETAMRIYYLAALCEKPDRFIKELKESPGWKQFLFPDGTPTSVTEKWIGKPELWAKETPPNGDRIGDRTKKTLENERKTIGLRGEFTRKNIFAESDTYVEKKLNEAIEQFLGGGEGASFVDKVEAESARRIAFRMFRLFLLADQEGYELLKDDSKKDEMDPFRGLEIVFENAPAASDFGKLTHPDMYAGKSARKGRDYMPAVSFLHAREYYSRFMVDFLRHTSAKTEVPVRTAKGQEFIIEERSLMERWWGYKGEEKRTVGDIDPKTGEKIEKTGVYVVRNGEGEELKWGDEITYLDEPAFRLGDLPWLDFNEPIHMNPEEASLLALPVGGYHFESFKLLWLSGFMAGGQDRAHMFISETNHNPQNLTDINWWNKFWKMLDVGIKKSVALEGKFRGVSESKKDDILKKHKVLIIENFIYGLRDLPQWEEWAKKAVEVLPNRSSDEKGKRQSPSPQLTDRIIDVANRALKVSGVEYKVRDLGDLLQRNIEPI